jgi:hypothetical protein
MILEATTQSLGAQSLGKLYAKRDTETYIVKLEWLVSARYEWDGLAFVGL